MEKKLIEVRDIYEYIGRCPKCGAEEKGGDEKCVDVLCENCKYLQKTKNTRDKYKHLICSTVVSIDNDGEGLTIMVVKAIDGKEYAIQTAGDGIYLYVDEVAKQDVK